MRTILPEGSSLSDHETIYAVTQKDEPYVFVTVFLDEEEANNFVSESAETGLRPLVVRAIPVYDWKVSDEETEPPIYPVGPLTSTVGESND